MTYYAYDVKHENALTLSRSFVDQLQKVVSIRIDIHVLSEAEEHELQFIAKTNAVRV